MGERIKVGSLIDAPGSGDHLISLIHRTLLTITAWRDDPSRSVRVEKLGAICGDLTGKNARAQLKDRIADLSNRYGLIQTVAPLYSRVIVSLHW